MQMILIGGPQSTGSSLLRQILNRHQQIHCLNETHLFAKQALYESWSTSQHQLFAKRRSGLKTSGWHIFTGLDVSDEKKTQLKSLLNKTSYDSFKEFAYDAVPLLAEEKSQIYMDKTPANIFCIGHAFHANVCQKAIITVRDPYDTVASLTSRGKHLMDAVVLVKSAFSQMLQYVQDDRIVFVKYEDLVNSPVEELSKLLSFLGLEFSEDLLKSKASNVDEETKIDGWAYDESSEIGSQSKGRFSRLSQKEQNLIIKAFNMISWKGSNQSIWKLMDHLQYDQRKNNMNVRVSFGSHLFRKLTSHWVKNNPYHLINNPITFSKNV